MTELVRWLCIANVCCAVGLAACGKVQSAIDSGQSDSAGEVAPPPSCVGLPTTCGASGNDSCCNSLQVPGGTYYRSYDLAGDVYSGNTSYPATVSSFRLDKYEVTVGRFRAFVNAGMGTQSNPPITRAGERPNLPGSGWDANWNTNLAANTAALIAAVKCGSTLGTWTDIPGDNEDRPMNCITWYEAMAFCAWDGGYLPTEAEWNYAATGGDQQRAYPWSSPAGSLTVDSSHASYGDGTGTNCFSDGMAGCALTDLAAVGTKPAGDGRWGQSDLGGNVNEWTLDWFAGYANPCADCANITAASFRILRGGSLIFDTIQLRAGARDDTTPTHRDFALGVRCARSL